MIVHSIIKIMKVVGLTGGIGSGKTIVSNVFIKLGIQVYNYKKDFPVGMKVGDLNHSPIIFYQNLLF